jgi:enoyl-CoA hydratase
MTVSTDRRGPVLVVTIERPERRNAVDGPTARALYDAFSAFDADPDLAVAVLQGRGEHFCAGADLQAMAGGGESNRSSATATSARWAAPACASPSR